MNLHSIVSGAIGAVNPFIMAQVSKSNGYATSPDGTQVPAYDAPQTVSMQKQALTSQDLAHTDGLNIQGSLTVGYINGAWYGVNRVTGQGGDLFVINGETWLVVTISELWPDWSRVILCLQR